MYWVVIEINKETKTQQELTENHIREYQWKLFEILHLWQEYGDSETIVKDYWIWDIAVLEWWNITNLFN